MNVKLVNTKQQEWYFGSYGGRYVPETLMAALEELDAAYQKYAKDPDFIAELANLYHDYSGRPTPLYYADRFSRELGGAKVYIKREDLNHTGAHKINNTLGQILLAKRMGKKRIIAETGAGQHGVATATVAAKFGLDCVVFMGEVDIARQSLNVFRMKLLGAEVRPVSSGNRTLKDAMNEAGFRRPGAARPGAGRARRPRRRSPARPPRRRSTAGPRPARDAAGRRTRRRRPAARSRHRVSAAPAGP